MPVRQGSARWEGTLKQGKGTVSTETGVVQKAQYSFTSRFESGKGTNPEELIAAAHAGCYSMAFSVGLEEAGFEPKSIETEDRVHIENVGDGFKITKIEINTVVEAPGIDQDTFQQIAEDTKKGCPVSQALTGVEFVLNAQLKS